MLDEYLLDCLLDTDHGVAPPVEQDVGGVVGLGGRDQLLGGQLYDAVITVEPAGVACVVHVCHIVTLGGLPPCVIDHGKQFVLPLFSCVLALTGNTQQLSTDLQINTELNWFHNLFYEKVYSHNRSLKRVARVKNRKNLRTDPLTFNLQSKFSKLLLTDAMTIN